MITYRWAEKADFRAIIEFVNRVFHPEKHTGNFDRDSAPDSHFPTVQPKLYRNVETAPMHILAEDEGKIIGCIGNFEMEMQVGSEILHCIGIGTVATDPARRGEGVMRGMMERSIERAKAQGKDLLMLGGFRELYARWGFESAGMNHSFMYSRPAFDVLLGRGAAFSFTFREITEADEAWLREAGKLRLQAAIHVDYDNVPEIDLLRTSYGSYAPYAILRDGRFAGCMLYNRKEGCVSDIRLKDSGQVLEVLSDFQREAGLEKLRVVNTAPCDQDLLRIFSKTSHGISTFGSDSIRILNYERTIRAFLGLKASYRPLCAGKAVIGFENGERVQILVRDGAAEVTASEAEPDFRFGLNEGVETLFCYETVYTDWGRELPDFWYSWFPLPFFIYHCDAI